MNFSCNFRNYASLSIQKSPMVQSTNFVQGLPALLKTDKKIMQRKLNSFCNFQDINTKEPIRIKPSSVSIM